MKRTYRPHIRAIRGPRYNSLLGWVIDWVAIFGTAAPRWWECIGHGCEGSGATPKEAYDAWYREFLMPYNRNPITVAAYRATKYAVQPEQQS
jgi:hypothetical protein